MQIHSKSQASGTRVAPVPSGAQREAQRDNVPRYDPQSRRLHDVAQRIDGAVFAQMRRTNAQPAGESSEIESSRKLQRSFDIHEARRHRERCKTVCVFLIIGYVLDHMARDDDVELTGRHVSGGIDIDFVSAFTRDVGTSDEG